MASRLFHASILDDGGNFWLLCLQHFDLISFSDSARLPCYNARMIRDEKHTISNDGDTPRVKRGKARSFAWVLVLAIGVALIVLGIAQGDMLDTWRKASLICYECIGIG